MPKHLTTTDSADFVQTDQVGEANGVAPLDGTGKIPATFLPSSAAPVTSVNAQTGDVVITPNSIGAIPNSSLNAANGVAPLDATGRLPVGKLPLVAVQSVNGYAGPSVTLTAADFGAISQATADGRYMRQDSIVYNAKEHGAVVNGVTDDAPAINAILSTSPAGSVVLLPPGDVAVNSPIIVPPGKTLMGMHSNLMKVTGLYDPATRIKPLATFTGAAVILFVDQATGGYASISGEQRLIDIMIHGAAGPAALDGIQAKGNIQNVVMYGVTIRDMTGNGIFTGINAGAYPYSWRLHRVMIDNCHAHGLSVQLMTDLTMIDCQAIGNWSSGFVLNNVANSQLTSCRAEWNGNHGYHITGSWGTGTGSGGMQMVGCGTDRNGYNGVYVDATGNAPIVISNLMTRRDGRNGGAGGGGYAGLSANGATTPLTIGNWVQYPGTDDDGNGTNSPQYGASFTNNTHVQVENAYLHANTGGLNNGGGNTTLRLGANITYATGLTSAPVRTVQTNYLPITGGNLTGPLTENGTAVTPLGWINVRDYGAVGDNTTDDTAAIQAAINACPVDGVVYFPAARYRTTSPLLLPPGVHLMGQQPQRRPRNNWMGSPNLSDMAYISPRSTFAGAAVIWVKDAQSGGWSTMAQGSSITNLRLNCSALPVGGTVDGIQVFGQVQGLVLQNVSVVGPSGYCFNFARNTGVTAGPNNPFSLRLLNCYAAGGGTAPTLGGYFVYNATDSSFIDCEVIGVPGDGWTIQGGGNTHFLGCRAENGGAHGFTLTQTAVGSGAIANMVGCSSSQNAFHGYNIASVQHATLTGCFSAGGEGATYSSFYLNSSTGITALNNCSSTVGGSSQYGVNVTGNLTAVINGGTYYGTTAGFHDGGTNTTILKSPNVVELTGSMTTPTVSVNGVQTGPGGLAIGQAPGGGNTFRMTSGTSSAFQVTGTATGQQLVTAIGADVTTAAFQAQVTGDTIFRFRAFADGVMEWGPGNAGRDTKLRRAALGLLATDTAFAVGTSLQVNATTPDLGGGAGVIGIKNATTAPTTNPTGGIVLYSEGGLGKIRQSNGTVVTIGSGGGGSLVGIAGARYVVSNTASSIEKSKADYLCDGTADNVQIQQAITDAQADGGGRILLSPGNFNIAAPITIDGTLDENNPKTITIQGCGTQVTELTIAANTNGIVISDWAQVNLSDFGMFISGSGKGIVSVGVNDTGDNNNVSFWHSSFRNLRINGGFIATDTVWGMELGMPWRSVFENIEIEGCRNGIKIINDATMQNAGDCVFSRMFVEIVGTGGYALYIDSIDGNMNQNEWVMFEAGANSTGCTGIYLGGTAGTASQRFHGLNLEQFQTGINVANGESNEFFCNYVTCDSGQAGNKMFVTGTNAYNNTFQAKWVNVETSGALKVIEDANTTSNCPNFFEKIRIENNTSGTVTYSTTASTVLKDITAFNTGNAMPAGLLRYPLSDVNDVEFNPTDHGLISWTANPGTASGSGFQLGLGQVYLSKIKIVNRATVVSNILYNVSTAGTALTAGQNFVGLYDASGARLALSADQTTNFGSTGAKTAALTSAVSLSVGYYYVAFLANGAGTIPNVSGSAGNSGLTNINLSTATARSLNTTTGNTALPTSITLGSQSVNIAVRWAGLS